MAKKQAISFDFNKPFIGLDGQPLRVPGLGLDVTIGQVIAQVLLNSDQPDPLKVYEWCKTLYANEPLVLSVADREKFKRAIETASSNVGVKGPALQIYLLTLEAANKDEASDVIA